MKNQIMLQRFEQQFVEIADGKEPIRSKRLANLMTNMEQAFEIPMRPSEYFEFKNASVMELYRKVSIARNFEEVD